MRYRASDIKLNLGESTALLEKKISKKYGIRATNLEIIREGLDARKKPDLKFVYTVDFDSNKKLNLPESKERAYVNPKAKGKKNIVIVGFGPSGIFASLVLSRAGYKVTVLEQGLDVDTRTKIVNEFWNEGKLNPLTNVQFGEGGAGTFSDGKLTTGIKDERIRFILREFVKHGANPDIMYKGKPHIGTDVLKEVVKNIRNEIIELGSTVLFGSKVTSLNIENGKVDSLTYVDSDGIKKVECDYVILAIGNSARDTFKLLNDLNVSMEKKPFSIGFRIEHDQKMIDISQYGKTSGELGIEPATYKLNTVTSSGRGVYTFCMCPGGYVINASSEEGRVCINGMSERNRDSGKANSAILCDVRPDDLDDDVLSGIDFQRKYEELAYDGSYDVPQNTVENYLSDKADNISKCVPDFANDSIREAIKVFGTKIKGFDNGDSILRAVETRSSCPIRIKRDEKYRSSVLNIYPIGEGAGYAGGIMSSAVDGVKIAEAICEVE